MPEPKGAAAPMPAEERRRLLDELAALRRQLAEADARIRQLEERLRREADAAAQAPPAESPS